MLASPLQAGREPEQLLLVHARGRHERGHLRLALGQRAGLVDHQRVDLGEPLQRLGVLDQHARLGAAPGADHDRHRRRQAERAGARDDQHRDRGNQGVSHRGWRPEDRPHDEGDDRDHDHRRDEPARDHVDQALDRRARALRLGDHLHDPGEHGLAADPLGAQNEAARLVDRAGADPIAPGLLGRHRLARQHRLVDRAAPFDNFAVDRDLVARAHPQAVADLDHLKRHFFIDTAVTHPPCGFGRELQQGLDRAAGALARPELEHLAEQHERHDHRRGLEVDVDLALGPTEGRREDPGRDRRDHAVQIRRADADPDQGPHVWAELLERCPAALEDRPPGPEHDRRRERQLEPVRHLPRDGVTQPQKMLAHHPDQQRQRQRGADPETPTHVEIFGARTFLLEEDRLRLERHAADRAVARADLLDVGMHRAGVDGVLGRRLGLRALRSEVCLRLRLELLRAARRAEIVGASAVLASVLRGVRIHAHAAHRVLHGARVSGLRAPLVGGDRHGLAPSLAPIQSRRSGPRLSSSRRVLHP